MSDGVHVRVDADGEAGLLAEARGLGVDQGEFRLGFAVEAVYAALQRVFHFGGGFADAREDDLRGIAAGLKDAVEFAAGDDVETRAGLGEERQHGQRGVGLHRVANGVRQGAERLRVRGIVLADCLAGIDVGRSAGLVREVGQRDLLTVVVVLRIGEHYRVILGLNFQYGTGSYSDPGVTRILSRRWSRRLPRADTVWLQSFGDFLVA